MIFGAPTRDAIRAKLPLCASVLLLHAACGARTELGADVAQEGAGGGAGAQGGGMGNSGADGGTANPPLPPGCWPELPGPKLVKIALSGGSFCMDSTEVTNRDYAEWLDTSPDLAGQRPACAWNDTFVPWEQVWPVDADHLEHPVAGVDFCDAEAYCRWAGKRLCGPRPAPGSLDEWRAACTHEGAQKYPYGDSFAWSACNGPEKEIEGSLPVGSLESCEGGYPGVFDLVGNVSEWIDECKGETGKQDPCSSLGGGWFTDDHNSCETRHGFVREQSAAFMGIRCCRDAE